MTTIADNRIDTFCSLLASRCPAPGGGAAAGVCASLGLALGAMAARYTTGKRYLEHETTALELADQLDHTMAACLDLAAADAQAYARVQQLRSEHAATVDISAAEQKARLVPLTLMKHCASAAGTINDFSGRCNPWLLSDLRAAIHLLHGAIHAAWEILHAGDPTADERATASTYCAAIDTIRASVVRER